jgi:hypothetical protein
MMQNPNLNVPLTQSQSIPVQKETLSKEEKNNEYMLACVGWTAQLAIWISLILLIVGIIIGGDIATVFIINFCVFYLIYILIEFCSPIFSYLSNIQLGDSMYNKMKILFANYPEIKFHCECYHKRRNRIVRKDSQGREDVRYEEERVTTYVDDYVMPYYSCKDVSGLFFLNIPEAQAKEKFFIKLSLGLEINFADAISYSDYIYQKEMFWQKNRFRDLYFDFNEKRTLRDYKKYNLVQIGNGIPKNVGKCYYALSVFLLYCEFYKRFIDNFCINQHYKIRKIISTRYNLLSQQYVVMYQQLVPSLNLIQNNYTYTTQETGYTNTSYNCQLPTEEELKQAEQYSSYVPNYQVCSVGGQMVVQDIPQFENMNYNIPPPKFDQYAGNVPLNQDQVISTGNTQNTLLSQGSGNNLISGEQIGYSGQGGYGQQIPQQIPQQTVINNQYNNGQLQQGYQSGQDYQSGGYQSGGYQSGGGYAPTQ